MAALAEESLNQRLGDHDAVAEVIGGLYHRMLSHYRTWYYWKGRSPESRAEEQSLFLRLTWALAGGPAPALQKSGRGEGLHRLGVSRVPWNGFIALAAETVLHASGDGDQNDELFMALARAKAALTPGSPLRPYTAGFASYAPGLTGREREVLRLVALGKSNSEIAQELYISINTVTRHLTNIFLKTDTRNRVEAAIYAVRHNMV